MSANTDEVDRHLAWIDVRDRGPSAQRSVNDDGGAESVFLVGGRMLTLLCSDDEGGEDDGTWFWAVDADGHDVFEFTVLRGAYPDDDQRRMVLDYVRAMGTRLPYALPADDARLRW